MPLNFHVVGLNHRTASVELREQVAFAPSKMGESLTRLCEAAGIYGAAILSTCNRTEVYMHAASQEAAYEGVCGLLEAEKGLIAADVTPHLYAKCETEAVRHLYEVVSSLDSMVLGEAQIAGQVKCAFKMAQAAGTTTMLLDRVFRQAREVGKRVRSQTGIGDAHISLSTVAVDVAKDKFGDLMDRTILIVGSGKMSELAARYLQEQGATSLVVASRTHAHARTVAKEVGATAHHFEDLLALLGQADIVISSTAAPHYVVVPEMLGNLTKPVLFLDLAMPRDIDPACADIDGVSLCDLDDLGTIAAMNQRSREDCTAEVRIIVDEEVEALQRWAREHAVTPTIKQIREQAEKLRQAEVARLLKSIKVDLSDEDKQALNAATSALVNKMLHTPTMALKDSALSHTDYEVVAAARTLFGLDAGQSGEDVADQGGELPWASSFA